MTSGQIIPPQQIIEAAEAELERLTVKHGRWTMTIPAKDSDSDLILYRLLNLAEELLYENRQLKAGGPS